MNKAKVLKDYFSERGRKMGKVMTPRKRASCYRNLQKGWAITAAHRIPHLQDDIDTLQTSLIRCIDKKEKERILKKIAKLKMKLKRAKQMKGFKYGNNQAAGPGRK